MQRQTRRNECIGRSEYSKPRYGAHKTERPADRPAGRPTRSFIPDCNNGGKQIVCLSRGNVICVHKDGALTGEEKYSRPTGRFPGALASRIGERGKNWRELSIGGEARIMTVEINVVLVQFLSSTS